MDKSKYIKDYLDMSSDQRIQALELATKYDQTGETIEAITSAEEYLMAKSRLEIDKSLLDQTRTRHGRMVDTDASRLEFEIDYNFKFIKEFEDEHGRHEDVVEDFDGYEFPTVAGDHDLRQAYDMQNMSDADYESFAAEIEMLRDEGLVQ